MKIINILIFLICAYNVQSQTTNQSIKIVRSNNLLSMVYPVKLVFNDSLIKIRNNETVVVSYSAMPKIYKSGLLGKKKELIINENAFLKVKHSFFFPFAFDRTQEIKSDEFKERSNKTKHKKEIKLF